MALVIARSIFMSNVQSAAANSRRNETKNTASISSNTSKRAVGRRELLLFSTAAATAVLVVDSQTDLLNKYLKKSEENKAKNDKERLESYYKRNYKDYFELLEGDLRQKKDLSESEKGILEWLDKNK